MFLTSYTSDRFKDRGIHITVLSSIAAIAYACLANLGDDKLSAKYGLMVGLNSNIPSILLLYLSHSKKTSASPSPASTAPTRPATLGRPQFREGHWICFAMSVATAVILLANSLTLRAVNRYRDRKFGRPIEGLEIDVSDEADRNKMFRFIT